MMTFLIFDVMNDLWGERAMKSKSAVAFLPIEWAFLCKYLAHKARGCSFDLLHELANGY